MIKLRKKDKEKLSTILQLPQYDIEKMAAMNLIHEAIAIDMLIVHDWRKLKRSGHYTVKQILQAIMNEYQVSKSKVQAAIYGKRKHTYSCTNCGKRILKAESERNDGLCDTCVSKTIEL
jgi:formylmethanofuran dehydrogenase subunit E